MKKLFILLASIMILSCAKEESDVLYVGTNAEYPPFEYLDENGNVVGFDIDLMNEISRVIGKKIEIKDMTFDGLIPALESKTIDILIAGITATESRKKVINFSKPYFESQQAIIVKEDNNSITNFDSLNNSYTVGVVLGYVGDVALTESKKVEKIERFNRTADTVVALQSGKIDAAIMDYPIAVGYVKNNEGLKAIKTDLSIQELCIGFRKEDTKLLEEINKALDTLKENGKYDELVKKYF
ncbi:basic amino acid ABC transporter substrate-binding protein [uncultured Brachyspira sp.]|uniref:basic amino acid ABC transporter substrate-binding protein n=1 Tax=uncultured Brachyspira sp. TaxID=221953 RepID=UPI0026308F4E|nr:basic amino acid ABC transporter substrate-binding protein [uncultured Brachyspira sp.]